MTCSDLNVLVELICLFSNKLSSSCLVYLEFLWIMGFVTNAGDNTRIATAHNELLCFLQDKCKILTFDDLMSIYSGFYIWNEVSAAKSLLVPHLKERLVKHTGSDFVKIRKTVSNLLQVVLHPNNVFPSFYATQLSHLPPFGVDDVDISALLQEVASLRAEVRSFMQLRSDF